VLHAGRRRLSHAIVRPGGEEQIVTGQAPIELRRKIGYAFVDDTSPGNREYVAQRAIDQILRDEGWARLPAGDAVHDAPDPEGSESAVWDELNRYLEMCPDWMVPTVVEALYGALVKTFHASNVQRFVATVNLALAEYHTGLALVGAKVSEIEARELHAALVAPALAVLGLSARFTAAESAYSSALEEIDRHSPGDAITDAGTALQETLAALGCAGDTLGVQITSAKKKGLLGAHDGKLTRAIEAMLEWASANRSQRGDAHRATDADVDDAWLMVHVVGALIVRLSRTDRS